jgi:hypothetical protein
MVDPDADDTPALTFINWGSCQSFVSGSFPKYKITPNDNKTDPGICYVLVVLNDDNPHQL